MIDDGDSNHSVRGLRQQPSLWRYIVLVTAIAEALLAQQLVSGRSSPALGWGLFLLAAIVAASAASAPAADAAETSTAQSRPLLLWRLAGGGVAIAMTLTSTQLATGDPHPLLALVLWLAAFAPATLAVLGWRVTPPARRRAPWTALEIGALLLIVLLGAAARFAWIRTLPPYLFHDEPLVATHLLREFRNSMVPNFFTMGWNSWSNVGISLQGIFVPFFGYNTATLRMASALMGTLAVVTTYLLGRELFNLRVALLAAFFLAVGRTGLEFSRLGVCHAQVLFLTTFAFYWWWRALNSGRAASYLWAGIGLGFCLYTYNAGHSTPVLWLGWVGLCVLVKPRRLATHWRGVLITLAGFALSTLPWLYYVTDHFTFQRKWFEFTWMARNRQVLSQISELWNTQGSGPALDLLWEQVSRTWLGFNVLPAGAYQIGYRGGGMLDHVTAALFILGLVIAATRLLRRDFFLVWWWLPTVIAGGVLTADPPATVRLVGILPALALFAALPLDALLHTAGSSRTLRSLALGAVALLLAFAGWDNWRTYFVEFAASPVDETSDVIRRLEKLPSDTTALCIGAEHWLWLNREVAVVNFAGQRVDDLQQTADFFPVHEPITTPLALVLGPTQASLTRYILSLYPRAEVSESYDPTPERKLRFRIVTIESHDLEARTGLQAASASGGAAAGEPTPVDPFGTLPAALSAAQRVRWTGAVYWPTHRSATLRVQSRTPVTLSLAGKLAVQAKDGEPGSVVLELPRGWQPLSIEETVGAPRQLTMTIDDGQGEQPLTRWSFRPEAAAEGLLAIYQRDGGMFLRTIEPQINSFAVESVYQHHNSLGLAMPFVADWQGALRIDEAGEYELEAIGSGPFSIRLDGKLLCEIAQVEQPEEPRTCSVKHMLSPGKHPIIAHFDSTHPANTGRRIFQLFWTPPGGQRELVPPMQFSPVPLQFSPVPQR
jgi:4-amino-4-deoxy-L-arabinose transferase-like glycosyltransferase